MTKKNGVTTQIFTLITGIFLLLLLISINEVQAWEACPPDVQVQSSNSNTATSITFEVDSSAPFPLDIMWVDQSGKMKKFHRLVPGQSYTQQTYVGHVWAARDGSNCEYFEATKSPMTAHIVVDDFPTDPAKGNNKLNNSEEHFGTNIYSDVRGWRVVQGKLGCSAYKPGSGPIVVFNTPPAGGWQIVYHYLNTSGDISGIIDIDKASFPQTFYADGEWVYGEFPLNLRLAAKEGHSMYTKIGSVQYEESLSGATAALLKLQECWQQLSGWTPNSNKAGTFAFTGN